MQDVSRQGSGHIYGSNIQFMGRLTPTAVDLLNMNKPNYGVMSQENDDRCETLAIRLLVISYVVPYSGSQVWHSNC